MLCNYYDDEPENEVNEVKEEPIEVETTTVESNNTTTSTSSNPNQKSKMAAGLLGIFLGWLGVHNFYLGYTGKAVGQLILSIVGILTSCIFIGAFLIMGASIWGLIEGIMILTGNINTDAQGNPLGE